METGTNILQKSYKLQLNIVSSIAAMLSAVRVTVVDRFLQLRSIELVVRNFGRKPSNVHLFNFFSLGIHR